MFDSLFAFACSIATSLLAYAFAMEADLLICSLLSIPRSLMRPSLSLIFCTLKDKIQIPSCAISSLALDFTCSENSALFWQISFNSIVPMISRKFPWRDFVIVFLTSSELLLRKFRIAISIFFGDVSTAT